MAVHPINALKGASVWGTLEIRKTSTSLGGAAWPVSAEGVAMSLWVCVLVSFGGSLPFLGDTTRNKETKRF